MANIDDRNGVHHLITGSQNDPNSSMANIEDRNINIIMVAPNNFNSSMVNMDERNREYPRWHLGTFPQEELWFTKIML